MYLIDIRVLSRLRVLNHDIDDIGRRKDLRSRISINGDDEISSLAGAMNSMLGKLQAAHDDLEKSESQYRSLIETTPESICLCSLSCTILFCNRQMAESFRYRHMGEVVGKFVFDLIDAPDRDIVLDTLKKTLEDRQVKTVEIHAQKRDGSAFWVEAGITLVRYSHDVPEAFLVISRDISRRKKADEAIRLANKKRNLLNSITRHDLLNTITGLIGLEDMALDIAGTGKEPELIRDIRAHTRWLQQQITFPCDYQDVGIHEPQWQNIRYTLHKVSGLILLNSTRLVKDIDDIEIYAVPMLERVFYNLLDNALMYGGNTLTTIRFSTRLREGGLILICEDDGNGIAKDEKELIFERGFGKNTGLGLFLTREILAITGITIRETGIPGSGARFEIHVPPGQFRIARQKSDSDREGADLDG